MEHFTGDEPLEALRDDRVAGSICTAAFGVDRCGLVAAKSQHADPMQCRVGLAVAAAIQPRSPAVAETYPLSESSLDCRQRF